jgi:hypothetical protein
LANNTFQVKRTSTAGRTPNTTNSANTQYINPGELALNMTDQILYTSDGTNLLTIGANVVNQKVTGTLTVNTVNASNNITLNNNKSIGFQTVNTSAYVTFIQQNDDNFVMYSTNTVGGQRPIWAVYANSITSYLNFIVPVNISSTITTGGSNGSVGQVLTSNGNSPPYWSSPGAASVNTQAQYTWTNTQTFSANISFTGNGISLATNTGALYFNGMGDNNWKMGRNTGSVTKWIYTNNSIDIGTANSNLEGFTIGQVGSNSYFETGYLGTYIRNTVTIGNSSSNATINSTAIAANSITVGSPNTATFTNINGQTNASSNFTGNAYAYLGGYGGNYLAFGQQTNFAQWIQSGYPSAGSPVYYNIILNPLGGNVGIGNTAPTSKLSVNGTAYLQGNVTFTQGIIDSTGSQGTAGQVLTSNGSGNVYWSSVSGGGGSVNVAAQYTWTNTQTFTNTITFSSTINGTANNSNYLNGVAAANYIQNSGAYTISGVHTHTANIVISTSASIVANGTIGTANQVLTSNGSTVYWANVTGGGASVTISDTAPSSPSAGNLWYSSATGDLYIYYTDTNGSQWVSINETYLGAPVNTPLFTGLATFSNGINVVGNVTYSNVTFTNMPNFSNSTLTNIIANGTITANSSSGTAGYVLTSGGSSSNVYWSQIGGNFDYGLVTGSVTGSADYGSIV